MFFDKRPTKYVLIAGSRDFEDYRTAKKCRFVNDVLQKSENLAEG